MNTQALDQSTSPVKLKHETIAASDSRPASCSPLQSPEVHTLVGPTTSSPVSVYTEWDPLEEVIVGVIDDIRVPEWDRGLAAVIPDQAQPFFKLNAGQRFPQEQVEAARREVDGLAALLQHEGIIVCRPDEVAHHRPVVTPFFTTGGGYYSAMPRDCLFAIGKKIIEVPMAWRSRYFETFAFRQILIDYFKAGAEWIAAPKPMLSEALWRIDHNPAAPAFNSVVSEHEPIFDAADFIKMGRDIIGQRSHVTNELGIAWLRKTLGPDYDIHIYQFDDTGPMHIDTTILPLSPGKVLVNKAWVSKLPDIFQHWDVLYPPASALSDSHPLYMTSKYIHTNILMLDERRVIVEQDEAPLIAALKGWGFTPIPCAFKHFQTFGGSFHCATLDIRRSGDLQRYT